MTKKNLTYCSIIDDDCIGFKRKDCKECKEYKKAIKKAYNDSMKILNQKYLKQGHLNV